MRSIRKFLLTSALVACSAAAQAQSFTDSTSGVLTQGNTRTDSLGVATSSSVPGSVSFQTNQNIQVSAKCGNATSPTLKYYAADGTTEVSRKVVACDTTPAIVDTLAAGTFPQTSVVVSHTGLTGVNTMTTLVSKQPK